MKKDNDGWSAKSGITTAAKAGIVVVLALLVLGGGYLAPAMLKGSGTSTSFSQTVASSSSPIGGNQTIDLLSLFGYFSQAQVQAISSVPDPDGPIINQWTFAYHVLGTASFNSTQHTKVEFSQAGVDADVVAWFNSAGVVDRLDVIGSQNYTGPSAATLAQSYTTAFSRVTSLAANSTLLSLLSKTSENTTSLGPTQLHVATYQLSAPTSPYKSITVQYATIPGTNQRIVVYVDQAMNDGTEFISKVLSLAK